MIRVGGNVQCLQVPPWHGLEVMFSVCRSHHDTGFYTSGTIVNTVCFRDFNSMPLYMIKIMSMRVPHPSSPCCHPYNICQLLFIADLWRRLLIKQSTSVSTHYTSLALDQFRAGSQGLGVHLTDYCHREDFLSPWMVINHVWTADVPLARG